MNITSASFSRHSDKNRLCYTKNGKQKTEMQTQMDQALFLWLEESLELQKCVLHALTMLIHRSSSDDIGTGTVLELIITYRSI